MKLEVPSVRWHWDDKSAFPLMAIDMHPSGRLATAGQDGIIRIWHIRPSNTGVSNIDFISEFRAHTTTINALRFSPNGMFLASAGDDKMVSVWRYDGPKTAAHTVNPVFGDEDEGLYNVENWSKEIDLSGHTTEIVDLAWHHSSLMLTTASMSGYVITWTVSKPTNALAFPQQPLVPVTAPNARANAVSRDFSGMGASLAQWLSNVPYAAAQLYAADYLRYAAVAGIPVADANGKVWAGAVGDIIIPGENSPFGSITFKLNTQKLISGEITGLAFSGSQNSGYTVASSAPNDNGDPTPLPIAVPLTGASELIQSLKPAATLCDHKLHVQGVAWDPLGRYLATLGADRALRVYNAADGVSAAAAATESALTVGKKALLVKCAEVMRRKVDGGEDESADVGTGNQGISGTGSSGRGESGMYFAKEQTATYYRRLHWSPDGTMLACPAGILDSESGKQENPTKPSSSKDGREPPSLLDGNNDNVSDTTTPYCSHIFLRSCLTTPAYSLPFDEPTIAARFSPVPLTAKPVAGAASLVRVSSATAPIDGSVNIAGVVAGAGAEEHKAGEDSAADAATFDTHPSITGTRYYYLLAVATTRSIIIYRSDNLVPLAVCRNVHHAPLTDIAWAADGTQLCVSSQDGFLSIIKFQENELGFPLTGKLREAYDAYLSEMQWKNSQCPLLQARGLTTLGLSTNTPLQDDLSLLTYGSATLATQAKTITAQKQAHAGSMTDATTGGTTGTPAAEEDDGDLADCVNNMTTWAFRETLFNFASLPSQQKRQLLCDVFGTCQMRDEEEEKEKESKRGKGKSESKKASQAAGNQATTIPSSGLTTPVTTVPTQADINAIVSAITASAHLSAMLAAPLTPGSMVVPSAITPSLSAGVTSVAAVAPSPDTKTPRKNYSDEDVKTFIRNYYNTHAKMPTKTIVREEMHLGHSRSCALWEAMHVELGIPLVQRASRKTADKNGGGSAVATPSVPAPSADDTATPTVAGDITSDLRHAENEDDDVLSPSKKPRFE